MRLLFIAAGAALAMGSCATMNQAQCLSGDWAGQGYSDGAAGLALSRLDDHAQACAKYGVTPDVEAYGAARREGLIRYCTVERGFEVGRTGGGYVGVCPAPLEVDFLNAHRDGEIVHAAEQALSDARSRVESLGRRLEELDDKIAAKQSEARADGLTEAQREEVRRRIAEIRRERADTERDWRRGQDAIDDAERDVRDVRWRFRDQYGSW